MNKILFSIFLFCCLIFCKYSFAMEDHVQYSMDQLLSYKNSELTLNSDQLAFAVNAGVFNSDKFIEEFSPKIIELGNNIISDLQQNLTIYDFQKYYFLYLLERIFDKNFFKFLILEQSLNLSKWEIEGKTRFGLKWLLQETFEKCPKYSINFENNFIREKLVPKLISFFNKFFVVKKVDLSNNYLSEFPEIIHKYKNVMEVIL